MIKAEQFKRLFQFYHYANINTDFQISPIYLDSGYSFVKYSSGFKDLYYLCHPIKTLKLALNTVFTLLVQREVTMLADNGI